MKRNPSSDSEKGLKAFRRRKVLTLEEVAELVQSSIHTARRRLKERRAHTSYNQNGRYYALPDVPEWSLSVLLKQVRLEQPHDMLNVLKRIQLSGIFVGKLPLAILLQQSV